MEENKSVKDKKNESKTWWFRLGSLLALGAVATPFLILFFTKTEYTVTAIGGLGTLGDFFGGSTIGLLSLASMLFVIHAISIQSKELTLQREEFELTREEFKTGNATAKVQQIDNAFFNMLSLHHQIVNNITVTDYLKNTSTGREAISKLKDIYEDRLGQYQYFLDNPTHKPGNWTDSTKKEYLGKILDSTITVSQEMLDEVYKGFHGKYGNNIGHYMRNNYRIVKFIVNNVADDEKEQEEIKKETGREPIIGDKRYYFGMLRAQWSNAEFELILVNSLYSENYKFKNLILKHDVLDIKDKNERKEKHIPLENFKLKSSMTKFKAYRNLIEINK